MNTLNRQSDIVVRYLIDSIMKNEISIGGKIPSTEMLAKTTGTSIVSAREAVKSLDCIGLLVISHGRGMFLKEGPPIIEDLLRARCVIESDAVKVATRMLSTRDIQKIESLLKAMDSYVREQDSDSFSDKDYEFHYYISKLANNRILSRTLENIKQLLYYQQLIVNRLCPEILERSLLRHRELFNAMKAGDPEKAGSIMSCHIEEVSDYWKSSDMLKIRS